MYGRGAELGNFKFFADDLTTTELKAFDKKFISIVNVERRNAFFDLLRKPPFAFKIKELHIYSHAWGGGLSLGYKDKAVTAMTDSIISKNKGELANYYSFLNANIGTVFTDDLIRTPYNDYKAEIRSRFAPNAKIKIWGCNSGYPDWVYSDPDSRGQPVYDVNAPAAVYYWRALNELNSPKPAIAQAFADYFQAATHGAKSGSSIQIKYKGKWISSAKIGRSVGEKDLLRLDPDEGDYYEYTPR